MTGKGQLGPMLAAVAFAALYCSASAAPWDGLLTLRRVEADPDKSYSISEENGPWMIMACSFSGENARQEAHQLAIELRARYKLPAYVYEKKFDFGDETYGRGLDKYGKPLKMRYQRGNEFTEVAVLVGNYPTVDDPEAQETLKKLKYSRPECLELDSGKRTTRTLAGLRYIQKKLLAPGNEKKDRGPMDHALITTNPLLSKDYFTPKGIDKFVQSLNEGIEHSLLDCPGKYTVQVAHFTGKVVMDQGDIRAIEEGRRMKSKLVEAGEKAEKLTEALRIKGYEAYVFHDRYASLVTVGSFDSVGAPRPDGKIEINPKIHAIMKTFGAAQPSTPGAASGGIQRKKLVGIQFDVQPIPVEVPRRSISSDYSRDALGMR